MGEAIQVRQAKRKLELIGVRSFKTRFNNAMLMTPAPTCLFIPRGVEALITLIALAALYETTNFPSLTDS